MTRMYRTLLSVAPLALAAPAFAAPAAAGPAATDQADAQADAQQSTDPADTKRAADSDMVTTGVARGRDRLDSATSTSSIKEDAIRKLAPRSLAEIFRDIPGMRAEAAGGEGGASISIRGLPIALGGAKFLQLQEDGLPTLEFGDIAFATADNFLRADLNLAQIDSIRGGSASTFASNSPGGIINLISKTGDVEGGAVQATTGIDYEEYRLDFDYGAKITDTLRFHIGGFYRQGEGPRKVGYDGWKGGQLKFNVTQQFDGGYIRLYGKYLDDSTPYYGTSPVKVTGTDSDPKYSALPGFDAQKDTLQSRYFLSNLTLDGNNLPERNDTRNGIHSVVKSVGLESVFDVGEWNISERFRFSDMSGSFFFPYSAPIPGGSTGPAQAFANALVGGPAVLSYATGPNAGQVITDPSSLNGNGLIARLTNQDVKLNSLNNVTNDLRVSRVWALGGGELTTTGGFYKSRQTIKTTWTWTSTVMEVLGDGKANLLNIAPASNPTAFVTQNGYFGFGSAFIGNRRRSLYDLDYDVNAPYASANYHIGKLSIGGSVRYDFGDARGSIYGADLGGGRVGVTSYDFNGDGVISPAERRTQILPLASPGPVHYDYHYLSYSTGVNFRVAEPFAVFGRYSRGSRANADRILFANFVSPTDGSLINKDGAYDPVDQAEVGAKYRKGGLTLNGTGFWAKTAEHNVGLDRSYRAYGFEFEGGFRQGPWSLMGGATYTNAKITKDALVAATVGNKPRHQPNFIFQATPQYSTDRFSVGAVIIGTTSSYAADTNQLKLPAFTTVNGFFQFGLNDRVTLSVNANNMFDVKGYVEADQATIPTNGIVTARAINGRTVSGSIRFAL